MPQTKGIISGVIIVWQSKSSATTIVSSMIATTV
jgi:hypothetical protein